jgi:hypothetical protein
MTDWNNWSVKLVGQQLPLSRSLTLLAFLTFFFPNLETIHFRGDIEYSCRADFCAAASQCDMICSEGEICWIYA